MFELLYYLIGLAVRIGIKPKFDLRVNGLDNYSESPSTLIVANHKRDLDSVLLASVFYFRHGYLKPAHPISFMGDENLFQPGFLGNWIKGPKILKKILQPLSLNYILHKLHAYPIGKLDFHSVPVHDALRIIQETNGDYSLSEVIKEEALADLLAENSFGNADMTISQFFDREGYPRKKIKSNSFKPYFRKAVKESKVFGVKNQLSKFIELLNEGEIIYITPEGTLSTNGMLGRLKDSLLILLEEADPEIVVTPLNITYDFTTDKKTTILVNIGTEITDLDRQDRKEQSETLRKTILKLTTINLGQLGSYYLSKSKKGKIDKIRKKEFFSEVKEYLEQARESHFSIDSKLYTQEGIRERWEEFLRYCENQGALKPDGTECYQIEEDLGRDRTEIPRGYKRNPITYCANEIKDLEKVGLLDL